MSTAGEPQRECGCPPCIIRCAHYDGLWLGLHNSAEWGWYVLGGSNVAAQKFIDIHLSQSVLFNHGLYNGVPSTLAGANAAFEQAEAELLGRS